MYSYGEDVEAEPEGHQGTAHSLRAESPVGPLSLRRRAPRALQDRRAHRPAACSGRPGRRHWSSESEQCLGERSGAPKPGSADRPAAAGSAAAGEVGRGPMGSGEAGPDRAVGRGRAFGAAGPVMGGEMWVPESTSRNRISG